VLLLHGAARYRWRHGIAAVTEEMLRCASCKAAVGQEVTAADSCLAAAQQMQASPPAQHTHMRQFEQPQSCAFGGQDAGEAPEGKSCGLCVRVVRGRRVSLTLRRLDPAQSMLDMQ
jgi:hypothetical protein